MKSLFAVTGAIVAISFAAGCGDDTANPFVFDAGVKDAAMPDGAKDGASVGDTGLDAGDSGAESE